MDYNPDVHSIKCPKCERGMERVIFDDLEIDRCTHCGGIWFDSGEAEALKDRAAAEFLDTGDRAAGKEWDMVEDIDCPRCGKAMLKSSDAKQSHIWIEYCKDHGMFLDAGEFKDYAQENWTDWFRDRLRGKRRENP